MLSIVIPIYNEKKTINEVIRRVQAVDYDKEIILVDDASTDGTQDFLKEYEQLEKFKVVYKTKNEGKGSALRAGFEKAVGEIAHRAMLFFNRETIWVVQLNPFWPSISSSRQKFRDLNGGESFDSIMHL